jgi:hypothetical protein
LHRAAPAVTDNFVDVSVPSQYNRDAKLCFDVKAKQLLRALYKTKCRCRLVCCNTVESCCSVENFLKGNDRRVQIFHVPAYHNAMTPESRNENWAAFARGKDIEEDANNEKMTIHLLKRVDPEALTVSPGNSRPPGTFEDCLTVIQVEQTCR